jgi:glycerol-3-phosphate dehydrogenase
LRETRDHYDAVVVGGGVNGVGIARDLALRGVSCLLLEKKDFGAGTSSASSGMIHGGPRYLLHDKDVTRLACLDSGYIQKIAPHLLFRIPFLYPVYKEPGQTRLQALLMLEGVEAFFEAYDRFVPLKNGRPHTRLTPEEALRLEPSLPADGLVGAVTFDEWGIDVPRLCIANAVDAVEHGASALNHAEATGVEIENNVFRALRFRDVLTGEERRVTANILINATGPWSPRFAAMAGLDVKLRGGKGVHIVLDRRLFNVALATRAIDGREIFILPYENTSVIGTTDDDYFGDLDDQRATEDEIKYLLEGVATIFPAVREARMTHSYSGVRPTLHRRKVYEDNLSREHEILDHEERDGVSGIISLIGGKLASYRIMAEETADLACAKLGRSEKSATHARPLPGGDRVPDVEALSETSGLDPYAVSRLVYRHGSRAERIIDSIRADRNLGALVCSCEPVTAAEIRHVVEHEMARTLSDVRMRTRLSSGPCQATNCLIAAGALLAELKSEGRVEVDSNGIAEDASRFLKEWWWNRAAVLDGEQFKQEELFQAIHFCNNGLDRPG